MVNQKESLKILNKEKNYEERIANDLLNYYIASLEEIPDINDEDKKIVKKILDTIARESQTHRNKFDELMTYVLNNGENEY